MNFLEYSNKNHCNIIPQKEFEELTHEVFNVISENLSKSLGPLGSSATILDGMNTEATKDGFSIFKSFRFHNRYKKMIYNLIKTPCTKLNNTVGDGTTTAIVFANCLYDQYKVRKGSIETMYRLPRTFIQTWNEVINDLVEEIKKSSIHIEADDYDTIYNIAYVTSNGNTEVSKNIADTYSKTKYPIIKQKNSPTNKSYISPIVGFEFPANLIDAKYIRSDDLSAEEKNIAVLIFDHKIETDVCNDLIIPLNEVLRAQGRKLLILAPYLDEVMCNTVLYPYANYEFQKYRNYNLLFGQFTIGKLSPHQLIDLATVLRTFVINQDLVTDIISDLQTMSQDAFVEKVMEDNEYKFYRLIGVSDTSLLSCKNGSIFRVKDIETDERYCDILRDAKKDLADIIATTDNERQSYSSKIYEAKTRISQLEMKNYIYYIGADSDLQKNILWDSVEDVIKCIRSAVKHGIVPGCQLSINKGCTKLILDIDKNNNINTGDDIKNLSDDLLLRRTILEMISSATTTLYLKILQGPENLGIAKTIPLWYYALKDDNGKDKLIDEIRKKCSEIVSESINRNQVFDLEKLEYNDKIITSAETDILVLLAASELIKILISGNQCVFLDSDVNESHNEDTEIYV